MSYLIKFELPEPVATIKLVSSKGKLGYVGVYSEEQVQKLLNEKFATLQTERNQAADNVITLVGTIEVLEAKLEERRIEVSELYKTISDLHATGAGDTP